MAKFVPLASLKLSLRAAGTGRPTASNGLVWYDPLKSGCNEALDRWGSFGLGLSGVLDLGRKSYFLVAECRLERHHFAISVPSELGCLASHSNQASKLLSVAASRHLRPLNFPKAKTSG